MVTWSKSYKAIRLGKVQCLPPKCTSGLIISSGVCIQEVKKNNPVMSCEIKLTLMLLKLFFCSSKASWSFAQMQSKKHPVQGTAVALRLGGTLPVAFVASAMLGKQQQPLVSWKVQHVVVAQKVRHHCSRDRLETMAKPWWTQRCWILSPALCRVRTFVMKSPRKIDLPWHAFNHCFRHEYRNYVKMSVETWGKHALPSFSPTCFEDTGAKDSCSNSNSAIVARHFFHTNLVSKRVWFFVWNVWCRCMKLLEVLWTKYPTCHSTLEDEVPQLVWYVCFIFFCTKMAIAFFASHDLPQGFSTANVLPDLGIGDESLGNKLRQA